MNRIVFLGTPMAAVPTLAALAEVEKVGLVVTQPDRPKGRSGTPVSPKVKEFADSANIPVIQPGTSQDISSGLESHGPFDVGVVVAYGRLLSPHVLTIPRRGMLNVHFSLLPRWRGAAPVSRALMAGDTMTGVTIIQIDEGLDTGPVLNAQALDIDLDMTLGLATDALATMGARLLVDSLPGFLDGSIEPVPQSDEGLTYAAKITPHDRRLTSDAPPEAFLNQVRGLSPTPGASIHIDGQSHKILQARSSVQQMQPGTWSLVDGSLLFGVGGGAVEITLLQPAGKTPQAGTDWVRGRRVESGRIG